MNNGIWFGVLAYALWGLFPIYWKWLKHIPALQLLSHRVLWSFFMLVVLLFCLKQIPQFRKKAFHLRVFCIYSVAALFIGVNWLTYIWAVNAGFIVETSLGYFINPLFSVLLGVLFFKERLRFGQWLSVGLATLGVSYLTWSYGALPWISLTLAFSFACYGFLKKIAPLGSIDGLTLETFILFFPAFFYLCYEEKIGTGAFLHTSLLSDALLLGAGLITTIPLLLFAFAAQRIPLSILGLLQYIAPTLQFMIGVLLYKEPFTKNQFIGFGLVWCALLFFGTDGFLAYRRLRQKAHLKI